MSVFVMTTGVLFKPAEERTSSKTGRVFVSATLKVGGETGNAEFWSITAFSESVQAELLRLGAGDALSAQGKAKFELYTSNDGKPKISKTIFCDHVLALRQPPRERKPKAPPVGSKAADATVKQSIVPPSSESSRSAASSTESAPSSFYDDEIPF
jgi:single-stranded DNA-binding protein